MPDGEADPGMHGVNGVGFNGRLGGRQRAECQTGEKQREQGMFHGRILSIGIKFLG
jgi:hypothetical protein